jgi:hypothetical protein
LADLWNEIKEKSKAVAGNWASYVTLGSFVLYLLGYLSLRFHLTTLGIGTDLSVLDERYVFTGARFLVYLFSTVPIIVFFALLLALLLALPLSLVYLLYRLAAKKSARIKAFGGVGKRLIAWWSSPGRIALTGIILSVLLIQFVMRQCYFFTNLLMSRTLPQTGLGLENLFLDLGDDRRILFFTVLVAGTLVTGWLLFYGRSRLSQDSKSGFLIILLAVLVGIQFLLLPVNYGVFIVDKELAKVKDLGGQETLQPCPEKPPQASVAAAPCQEAWLVWEGNDGVTYFVRTTELAADGTSLEKQRSLVTLPRKEVKRTEIIGYDPILRNLFRK